ncbi:hypothetical protein ABHF33_13290 [Chitinibacter sp. FCG-7]|uniref:Tetratricopeptide repeat protein n=1 Tax=Chitinibacter mangrovi TaxID=3153927 RepID=A0AAU7F906_9NEIS
MTLIIAKITENQINIIGDTKLTIHKNPKANPYKDGCLKQYILNDTTAIAFAGLQEHFEEALPKIKKANTTEEIINITCAAQKEGADFELLLADLSNLSLKFIKNSIVSDTIAGYLGDKSAFEIYQKYYHTESNENQILNTATLQIVQQPDPQRSDYSNCFNAFKKTMLDPNNATTGGVLVPLCSHQGKFRYMGYADINSDPIILENLPTTPTPITFGSAEKDGFSVEFFSNNLGKEMGTEPSFYCLQGEFGILYKENTSGLKKAILINAKNPAFWWIVAKKLTGISISSAYLTIDHCGVAGEYFLRHENYTDARECYTLGLAAGEPRREINDRYTAGYVTSLLNIGEIETALKTLNAILEQPSNHPMCHALRQQITTKLGL